MSIKERNKLRRYVGSFQTKAERHWRAETPFLYKRIQTREQLFNNLQSQGRQARVVMDRCRHMKGLEYEDAEEIALTLWTPEIE